MAPTRPCRSHPHRSDRDLAALARQLDLIAEEVGWGTPPLLIGLTDDGVDEVAPPPPAPGSRGGDPDDLVASLVGFDAPDDWLAMAVVVQGRSWALDDPGTDPRPMRLAHVVDRAGAVASVIRVAGEAPTVPTGEGEGRLVDVCRRSLGLSTPPPPDSTAGLWARLWLDGLLAAAARGEAAADRATAVRYHPAIALVADHEPALVDEAVERLTRVAEIMAAQRSWAVLRAAAACGEWPVEGLDPDGAAWMDDGMFARWVLAGFPGPEEYLTELAVLLPEAVVAAVRAELAGWDLLAPS